jgi:hypothetical protein
MGHETAGLDVLEAQQSDGTYLHYRANNRAFEEIATYYENVVNLSGVDGMEAERVPIAMVSTTCFTVLGARTLLGRLPNEEEVVPGRGDDPYVRGATEGGVEVLLSHDLWQRRFGGDPEIIGRTIESNRASRLVIGVLEPGFAFPRSDVGIWYPEDPDPATASGFDMFKHGIGRLRHGSRAAFVTARLASDCSSAWTPYARTSPHLREAAGTLAHRSDRAVHAVKPVPALGIRISNVEVAAPESGRSGSVAAR